jgi:hypothetical protein
MGRWEIYANAIVNATKTGTPPDWSGAVSNAIVAFELGWANASLAKVYPTAASGTSPVVLASAALDKYAGAAALAGFTAIPGMDARDPPAPPANWVHIADGEVAVGDDCPFLVQGPTDSLEACKAACVANSACNELNVLNGGGGGSLQACVLRQCVDPLHPQKTAYPAAWSMYGLNRTASAVDIMQAWHTDPAALAAMCAADSGCAGFNSNGWLKANVSDRQPTANCVLYVKNGGPTAAPLPPPSPAAAAAALAAAPRPPPPTFEDIAARVPGRASVPSWAPPEAAASIAAELEAKDAYGSRGAALRRAARGSGLRVA